IVAEDLGAGKYQKIHTRFPPEPNGYLHIGHAKSICLNFGIAREFGGVCNLRYDDTNPTKEEVEYVDSIFEDVRWLISGWADHCLGLKPKGKRPRESLAMANPISISRQNRSAGRRFPAANLFTLPIISTSFTNTPCNSSAKGWLTCVIFRPRTQTNIA